MKPIKAGSPVAEGPAAGSRTAAPHLDEPGAGRPGLDRRAVAAAAVTVVLWASAFVSIRSAGAEFGPGPLALGRLLAGTAVLGLICAVRREGLPPRAAWPGILVSGLVWFGVYMVVLNWGEQQVDAGTAAMVVNIGPLLVALLGGWLLREGFPRRLLAGMAVSFGGAVVVGLSMSGSGSSSIMGVLLCVAAAVSYATGVVAQKPALRHASALQVTTFGCAVGAVACLPFSGRLVTELADAPAGATLNMVYLGVFPTALAFTTWAYALARTSAGRMGATTYAVPALVVLMSWAALGEIPGTVTLAGGLLCLAGVAVSRGSRRRAAAPEPVPHVETVPSPDPGAARRSGTPSGTAPAPGRTGTVR
ncbi:MULTISPECIES: DMT family transporter [Thermomonosporaceae]|uniref:DMT family transporter n=1 Tax=Thermomonosporaceae TaxID=2012 RepID=UPI00255ADAC3|nr:MULTISPECIES: DMT family transporter [Thermomonosporaceae]MDL4771150.1 DMT family transporter [Actinomadura xylanilytica]